MSRSCASSSCQTLSGKTPADDGTQKYWFIFCDNKILTREYLDGSITVVMSNPADLGLAVNYQRSFGHFQHARCYLAEVTIVKELGNDMSFRGMRSVFERVDSELFKLVGRAFQLLHHYQNNIYCPRCGNRMSAKDAEHAMVCSGCGFTSFPQISPAVIMAVTRGDKILLGRASRFRSGMYSTLAGFVEPGETLEETVAREVFEETGIKVGEITYFGSQPWPFPHSLMVGFTAVYREGSITIDENELEDARWFSADNLPPLPSEGTIARALIENFRKQWR